MFCFFFILLLLYWCEYNPTFEWSPTPKFWANFRIGYAPKYNPTPKFGRQTVQKAVYFVNLKERKCQPLAKVKQFEDNKNDFSDWYWAHARVNKEKTVSYINRLGNFRDRLGTRSKAPLPISGQIKTWKKGGTILASVRYWNISIIL